MKQHVTLVTIIVLIAVVSLLSACEGSTTIEGSPSLITIPPTSMSQLMAPPESTTTLMSGAAFEEAVIFAFENDVFNRCFLVLFIVCGVRLGLSFSTIRN